MTECVILLRNPNGGRVVIIMRDDGDGPHVWPNQDDAIAWAENSKLCFAWPYQIVELEEL